MARLLFFLVCVVLFMNSCKKDIVFDKELVIKNSKWSYNDTLNFDFDVKVTEDIYDMYLIIGHDENFGFQNLYTKVTTTFPNDEKNSDIISLNLTDNMGSWNGECSGSTCYCPILLKKETRFLPGKYRLEFSQYSRSEIIDGINSLELKIERLKEKASE